MQLSAAISTLRCNGAWRSLVAHLLWEQGVAGSNPAAPTRDWPVGTKQGLSARTNSARLRSVRTRPSERTARYSGLNPARARLTWIRPRRAPGPRADRLAVRRRVRCSAAAQAAMYCVIGGARGGRYDSQSRRNGVTGDAPPAPPGWYQDPDDPGVLRYWDGTGWSSSPPTVPPPGSQVNTPTGTQGPQSAKFQAARRTALGLLGRSAGLHRHGNWCGGHMGDRSGIHLDRRDSGEDGLVVLGASVAGLLALWARTRRNGVGPGIAAMLFGAIGAAIAGVDLHKLSGIGTSGLLRAACAPRPSRLGDLPGPRRGNCLHPSHARSDDRRT